MGCCGSGTHQLREDDPFFEHILETDYFWEFVCSRNPYDHSNKMETNLLMSYLFHSSQINIEVLQRILKLTTQDINKTNGNGFAAIHYAVCRDIPDLKMF